MENASDRSPLKVLRRRLQTITRNVYSLYYLRDEGEVFCDILVDGATVVHMEIPPEDEEGEIVFRSMTLAEYRRWKGKMSRLQLRRLELALELARNEGNGP